MELLAVVMLIAIIGSVGAISYRDSYRRTVVEKAAKQLVLMAKYGRILAIEQQVPFSIELDIENGGFWLSSMQWNEETEESTAIVVRDYYSKPVELDNGVYVEDLRIGGVEAEETTTSGSMTEEQSDSTTQKITFRPDGTADEAIVQIGDGTIHFTVNITAFNGRATAHVGQAEAVESRVIDLDTESR